MVNEWDGGFTGEISVTNDTYATIENWSLELDFGDEIMDIWGGVIESHNGNHYVIKNSRYNSNIAPGETAYIGFTCKNKGEKTKPKEYKLYAYEISTDYTVKFNLGSNNVTNIPQSQKIEKGKYATKPTNPTREGYIFAGWYTDKTFTTRFDFDSTLINRSITLYARWFDYVSDIDTDKDGIIDTLEELFGTDINNPDTDGDGLSDFDEIYKLNTNPLLSDTDKNGIEDGNEDFDSDKITNLEELEFGTNPVIADTDGDKLNDYEEINTYGTDPLNIDTDEDGVSDGKEIEMGTDPLVKQTSFETKAEALNNGKVNASVKVELTGDQVDTLSVEVINNNLLFPDTIPGYIGEAYNFNVEGSFDSATISFEFDKELLRNKDFDPVIYYFNEEEQELEALNTSVVENVASAVVDHFSTYILINTTVYEDSFVWIDEWESTGFSGVETVIVIDDSGSMGTNDKNNERLKVAKSLIEKLPQKSKVGVVSFNSTNTLLTSKLTDDRNEAMKYLSTSYFKSSGGTNMYAAIDKSFSLFEEINSKDTLKMMIVLSDGQSSDTSRHSSILSTANSKNVRIYTVGLGNSSSYFNNYLKPLAVNTAGKFYIATQSQELASIYDDINMKIDIEMDSDKDGISDYYEDNMVIFNGTKILLDKNNPDTDGDGLLDGEEIVDLKYYYNTDKTKVKVVGKLKSNPASIDSDNDGLYDNVPRLVYENTVSERIVAPIDPEPLVPNGPDGVWDNHVNEQKTGIVPTEYISDNGFGSDKISGLIEKITENQFVADIIVGLILKLREPVTNNEDIIRTLALLVKKYCNGEAATVVGAFILNFVYDENKIAYHSQPDTWQRAFGYNDFYDEIFRIGSYMNYLPVDFMVNGKTHILWLWKGDYWNLHSGAEIGLYKLSDNASTIDSNTTHYDAIDYEVGMTLSLYNYNGENDIDNIFNWAPNKRQWWITGFSGQNPKYLNPDENKMVTVGSIDLSEHEDLFNGLLNKISKRNKDNKTEILRDTKGNVELIFDKNEKTVWINWYKGVI